MYIRTLLCPPPTRIPLPHNVMGVDKTWTPSSGHPSGRPSGPPSGPLNVLVKIKKDNRLKLDKVCVLYNNALFALKFRSLQYSVERRFPLDTTHFQDYFFNIYKRIRNSFAISHSKNFFETCHFQVAWTPAILFSAILGFPLTNTNRGRCSTHDTQPRKPGGGVNPYMGI